jgi:DNA-directed RNA polymerase subunit M/transcription elongation factor TFIIS
MMENRNRRTAPRFFPALIVPTAGLEHNSTGHIHSGNISMSISTECPECGKHLKAPDSAAGRKAKCPQCGAAVPIPEPVYEAEEVFDEPGAGANYGDVESADAEGYELSAPPPRRSSPDEDRRPCPMCGEMIKASAVKCRYCGEVFDDSLRHVGGRVDSELIRKFRREAHGVAGLWIVFALLFFLSALAWSASDNIRRMNPDTASTVAAISVIIGVALMVAGICGALKQLWALYAGLILSYLLTLLLVIGIINAAGQQPGGVVCPIVMLIALVFGIIQGHRVIGFANQLRRGGVSLTSLP